jgi:hypothetical protein
MPHSGRASRTPSSGAKLAAIVEPAVEAAVDPIGLGLMDLT